MKRNVSLSDISDGRLYSENDMVKADCRGCNGCSDCCHGMGESIILDPFDICRLTGGLGKSVAELLAEEVLELHTVDGVILPNLRMVGEEEKCAFLNASGRCEIHPYRPGICRLFPLGRYYLENGDFKYFLQTGECKEAKSKIKVNKWIDTPVVSTYHQYIVQWHALLNKVEKEVMMHLTSQSEGHAQTFDAAPAQVDEQSTMRKDEQASTRKNEQASTRTDEQAQMEYCKQLTMGVLQIFFLTPYTTIDTFYEEFDKRYSIFSETFSI